LIDLKISLKINAGELIIIVIIRHPGGQQMLYQYNQLGGNPEYLARVNGSDITFPEHIHENFEIIFVREGETYITVNSVTETVHKGEAILIFPNLVHSIFSTHCRDITFVFSPLFVQGYSNTKTNKIPVSGKFRPDDYLAHALESLSNDSSTAYKKGVLYLLLDQFEKQAVFTSKSRLNDNTLSELFLFVDNSFAGNCSLRDASAQIGYDYKYLSRLFKRSVGINFNEYVNNYRLAMACHLMINTDKSILQCSEESGYSSVRSFNRNFKDKFYVTPMQYRKQNGRFGAKAV
jgi:AraC-like DNA-binding protein